MFLEMLHQGEKDGARPPGLSVCVRLNVTPCCHPLWPGCRVDASSLRCDLEAGVAVLGSLAFANTKSTSDGIRLACLIQVIGAASFLCLTLEGFEAARWL